MKISFILCFSFICVLLEARPEDSTTSSELDIISGENEYTTMTGENVDVIENVETEDKIQLTSDVPTTDDLQNASDSFVSSVSSENVSRKEQLLDKQDVSVDEDKETVTTDIKEEGHDEAPEEKKGIVQIGDIATNKTVSEEKLGESREEDSVELGQETPILQNTRRTHSPLTPIPTDVVTLPPDKADEILETRSGFGIKPVLPLPIPKLVATSPLPKPYGFTTQVPYLNPVPYPNYPPNPPAYYKGFSAPGPYNRKPLPGVPVFPIPPPALPLIDEFAANTHSNAYPLLGSPQQSLDHFSHDNFPKDLYSKLMQASEHPVPPFRSGLQFGNTGYQNPPFFTGQKDFNILPYTLKRNV